MATTHILAGEIARAILAGTSPDLDWAQKREWIIDHTDIDGHGRRTTIAPFSLTEAEYHDAIAMAEAMVEDPA